MRKLFAIIAVILYHFAISNGFVSDQKQSVNAGNPSAETYSIKQAKSRSPWDMIIDGGKLYIGGGDYNDNTGPVDIYCMDLTTKQWTISGTANDEAIGKFVRIGDRVYAPGFDAKGANSTGNFYWLENGQWQENNSIPGAAHNYDIIEYDGMLLFAIGTWTGTNSPVQATEDNGQTFHDIPFYKDNVNIIDNNDYSFMRVYDFFTNNNGLYCIFVASSESSPQNYEFYHYKNGAFHFITSLNDGKMRIKPIKQEPIASEVCFQGQSYIAAYYLNRTSDFKTFEELPLPRNEVAVDLLLDGDQLYVLCAETKDKTCDVRVYAYVYNSFFYPILSFESENLPISFAKSENNFYIGLGKQGYDDEAAGTVITVTVPELTMQLIKDCIH